MNFAHPHLSPTQIQTMDWLAVLNAEQQAYVASTIEVTAAAPGDIVCRSGQQPTHWIGVVQGLVKMSENAANGRTVTFAGFPPGGWFGEGTLLEEGCYRYEIQSLQDSVLAQLPATVFHRLLRESIGFNQFLMRQFNKRLGQFIAYKAAEHTLPLEQQLARALVTLFDPGIYRSAPRKLKITQQELGYLVGTTRQQINQALQVLEQAHAARAGYGGVELLDFEKLRALCNVS